MSVSAVPGTSHWRIGPASTHASSMMVTVRDMRAAITSSGLEEIRRLIGRAGVIAMPTETYYALGASPFSGLALERLVRIKGRPGSKPILVLVADRAALYDLVADVPRAAEVLMTRFWPGPLTIVLPARSSLPALLTAGTGTVGIRQPDHAELRTLLAAVGPLTGTSANRSGDPPSQSAEAVHAALGEDVDMIVDGGCADGGLPSTVVSVMEPLSIVREGRIAREEIGRALSERGMQLE